MSGNFEVSKTVYLKEVGYGRSAGAQATVLTKPNGLGDQQFKFSDDGSKWWLNSDEFESFAEMRAREAVKNPPSIITKVPKSRKITVVDMAEFEIDKVSDDKLPDFGPEDRHYITKPEAVDHPAHYGGDTSMEAIKVIEAWELNFNLGNTAKYICRAGKKGQTLQDLKKAAFYLNREIAKEEAE